MWVVVLMKRVRSPVDLVGGTPLLTVVSTVGGGQWQSLGQYSLPSFSSPLSFFHHAEGILTRTRRNCNSFFEIYLIFIVCPVRRKNRAVSFGFLPVMASKATEYAFI